MGTDTLGRDILTRVVYGGRIDLTFAFITTLVPFVLGALVGAFAGYRGGWLDTTVNRFVDTVVAFPFIVLILAIVAITGPGLTGAYIGVFAVGWALYARLTRGEMLIEREREYILAAKTLGYSSWRIVFRHALPNVLRASIVFAMADVVLNILLLSSLSYLGLGAVPPSPEWGALVADGKDVILTAWWVATMPGLVIVVVGVAFSLIGDGIADRLGKDFTLTGRIDGVRERISSARNLLEVRDLTIAFPSSQNPLLAADGVNFDVAAGRTVGLVGESGCGKSVTLRSLLGLVPYPGEVISGEIRWQGEDLREAPKKRMAEVRGSEISMVFQDPTSCLNPVFTVGDQITETLRKRAGMNGRDAKRAGDRAPRSGRRSVGGAAPQGLPPPVQRRNAAAGDDRDRDLDPAEAVARGRADDGPRRDHPGGDPGVARRGAGGDGDGRRARLPRPRRDLGDLRRRLRHVRRQGPRGGPRAGRHAQPPPPLYRRPDRGDAVPGGHRRAARLSDPGAAAEPRRPASRLPVLAALPLQQAGVRLDPGGARRPLADHGSACPFEGTKA